MVQKKFYIYVVMLISLTSCKIDREGVIDRDKFTFRAGDDSYLFFKNVRQIYYDVQELPKARWIAYRHGNRYQGNSRPALTPVIVVDWFKNEAYLLVEPNELLAEESSLIVREEEPGTTKSYEYALRERGRENMLEFATKIYEGIMAGNKISVRHNNHFVPLFPTDEDADLFRIVMSDYYRLTKVF